LTLFGGAGWSRWQRWRSPRSAFNLNKKEKPTQDFGNQNGPVTMSVHIDQPE